ncbi:MAG: CAP domain-containing protein [Patescibacteria group bacterium]|nr:hypothetical protein [Patescibacteria group bacterium]MBU1876793.1 hypothetical protein [Patescibacteria group bacterium]
MKLKITFLILIVILGNVFFFWNDILDLYSKIFFKLPQIEKELINSLTKRIETKIIIPEPLKVQEKDPEAFLTEEGIIIWTNIQRNRQGLLPLEENSLLDAMVQAKLEDMFSSQYFAHQSPTGFAVGDLAKDFGYEFIVIGENLALGDFKDDQVLVQAWMDSPGHRENILNEQYQEIGVAVGKGVFNGVNTWLAVQHFGLSFSSCPQIDKELKAEIETNQEQIKELQKTLELLQIEIRTTRSRRGPVYNQLIEEYNSLTFQYNELIKETRILINKYNYQVTLFNECVFVGE